MDSYLKGDLRESQDIEGNFASIGSFWQEKQVKNVPLTT